MPKSIQKFIHERVRLSLKSTTHAEAAGLRKAKVYDMLWIAGHYRLKLTQLRWLSWIIFLFWQRVAAVLSPILLCGRKGGEEYR